MAKRAEPPTGYVVWKQSTDYLYGWNWKKPASGEKGYGYSTRKSAVADAIRHSNTTECSQCGGRKEKGVRCKCGWFGNPSKFKGAEVTLRVANPQTGKPLPGRWTVTDHKAGYLFVKHASGTVLKVHPSVVRRINPSVVEMKQAYEEFHWGTSAKKVRPAHIPGAKGAVFEIGHLHAVAYSTYKRGQGRAVWEHKFGEGGGKKPRLVTDGKRLFVVGGTYTIRPEGITG